MNRGGSWEFKKTKRNSHLVVYLIYFKVFFWGLFVSFKNSYFCSNFFFLIKMYTLSHNKDKWGWKNQKAIFRSSLKKRHSYRFNSGYLLKKILFKFIKIYFILSHHVPELINLFFIKIQYKLDVNFFFINFQWHQ